MDKERPSVTTDGAAVMLALHQTLDYEPKILDDPISPRLVDTVRGAGAQVRRRASCIPSP